MTTQDIYNYRFVNDQLITGGQPTEEQIKSTAAEGFQVVINLATFDPQHSLPDEAGLVRSLGMMYYHIPVEWSNPQESDFAKFEQVFKQVSGNKTLLHCAANFRATAFYSLYAMKNLGWSETRATISDGVPIRARESIFKCCRRTNFSPACRASSGQLTTATLLADQKGIHYSSARYHLRLATLLREQGRTADAQMHWRISKQIAKEDGYRRLLEIEFAYSN